MWSQLLLLSTLSLAALCTPADHNLPVLFQFDQPTHNVAVFRGAALKDAIAKGFGSPGNGRGGKAINVASSVGGSKAHAKPVGHTNNGNIRHGKAFGIYGNGKSLGHESVRTGKAFGTGGTSGIGHGISVVGTGLRVRGGLGGQGGLIGGHGSIGGHGIIGQHGGGYGYNGGYDEKPDPFYFKYGVHDDKYYTDFSEERSGDEAGNIKGEYTVALPDGRIQDIVYHADGGYGGTIMEVSYKGEARHPDIIHH